jgi:selenocysteine lyase/cysteine desulfurase
MVNGYKHLFPRAAQGVYLDSAAEGLLAPGVNTALAQYYEDKQLGTPGRKRFHAVEQESRTLVAELLRTDPQHICFLPSASDSLLALMNSLHWEAGDEVVITDLEFPSNIIPWLRLRKEGVKVTVVKSVRGELRLEDILASLTPRTKLVPLTLVSYKTGAYFEHVEALASEVHRTNAILAIDATQALGRLPVDVEGVDYLFCSSFKWLMSTHGLGLTYVSPRLRDRLDPRGIGWYSVTDCFTEDRFERYELKPGAGCMAAGMPNFPAIYALRVSLRFLREIGVEAICDRLVPVMERLHEGAASMGVSMLMPERQKHVSGIVAFEHPDAARVGAALEERGIVVWAGDGRVRASAHLYNDLSDVEIFLGALKDILRQGSI